MHEQAVSTHSLLVLRSIHRKIRSGYAYTCKKMSNQPTIPTHMTHSPGDVQRT